MSPRGPELLTTFLSEYKDHERRLEALVALAEYALRHNPPDLEEAEKWITQVRATIATMDSARRSPWEERIETSQLLLAELSGDPQVFTKAVEAYLTKFPQSPDAIEWNMKLGQTYFQIENYAKAETVFATLARSHPDSPMAESALYFAARSAMSLLNTGGYDRAVAFLQLVEEKKGPLAREARLLQAFAERRLGQDESAAKILAELDKESSRAPVEFQWAVAMEWADLLFAGTAATTESKEQAIQQYQELVKNKTYDPGLRVRGALQLFQCLMALNRQQEAIEQAYTALRDTESLAEPDRIWHDRLGLELSDAMQARGEWRSAIRLADTIAASGGPKAAEAKQLAAQLRLAHMVWDDKELQNQTIPQSAPTPENPKSPLPPR
jgi:tetratricopeptide (TPR) repeat protein